MQDQKKNFSPKVIFFWQEILMKQKNIWIPSTTVIWWKLISVNNEPPPKSKMDFKTIQFEHFWCARNVLCMGHNWPLQSVHSWGFQSSHNNGWLSNGLKDQNERVPQIISLTLWSFNQSFFHLFDLTYIHFISRCQELCYLLPEELSTS